MTNPMSVDWSELRGWIQLALAAVGGTIALLAYVQNLRQRRVENALKFIALFRDSLRDEDLAHWRELFVSTSEPAGAPRGQYFNALRSQMCPLSDHFSEGAGGDYAISRLAQSLDVLCHQVVTSAADAQTVYYEVGQLLQSMHTWLSDIPGYKPGSSLLVSAFPSIAIFFVRFRHEAQRWPCRIYAFIE
jgi:hypothetical protein